MDQASGPGEQPTVEPHGLGALLGSPVPAKQEAGPVGPALTCGFTSGWGDLNSRPLDPQVSPSRAVSYEQSCDLRFRSLVRPVGAVRYGPLRLLRGLLEDLAPVPWNLALLASQVIPKPERWVASVPKPSPPALALAACHVVAPGCDQAVRRVLPCGVQRRQVRISGPFSPRIWIAPSPSEQRNLLGIGEVALTEVIQTFRSNQRESPSSVIRPRDGRVPAAGLRVVDRRVERQVAGRRHELGQDLSYFAPSLEISDAALAEPLDDRCNRGAHHDS